MSLINDLPQIVNRNFAAFEEEVAKDTILQELNAYFPQALSPLIASHLQLEEELSIDCEKILHGNSTDAESEQQLQRVLEQIQDKATYVKKLALTLVGNGFNTELNLKSCVRLFETVSQHCSRLSNLTIRGYTIPVSALRPIIFCQKLHTLNLRIGIFTSWGKHISIPEYRDQQEKTMTKDKQGEIGKLLAQFSRLTQLEAQGLIDNDIKIITKQLPLLTQLRLANSSAMTKKSMKYIATLTHLTDFSFGSTEMEMGHFSFLQPLAQSLQNLSLEQGEQLQRLGPLAQLQTLTLNRVTTADLTWILVNCPALKELHLKPFNNRDLTLSSLLTLKSHTQLQKIKVDSFNQVFREELELLKPSFPAKCCLEVSQNDY